MYLGYLEAFLAPFLALWLPVYLILELMRRIKPFTVIYELKTGPDMTKKRTAPD